jgi:APA family basic amino acid/polyamine antiporter
MAQKQKLNLFALTSLVAGNMIGSGIFILPANLARIGSISLLAWLFTAAGSFFLAIVFSKMSCLVPRSGGPYVFVEKGFGKFMGFQTAYIYWVYTGISNIAITIALIGYLQVFIPQLINPTVSIAVSICIIGLFTWINISGIQRAGIIQIIMTIFKLTPLVIVGLLGWKYFHLDYIFANYNVTNHSDFSAFSQAAILTLWAFTGMESAVIPFDSVINPERNIPIATLLGTLIAAILYIACSAAIMGMIPMKELVNSASPFAIAAKMIFGKWGEWIVAGGAVASCAGCLNGWILIQSQVAMTMADNNLLPKVFAYRNKANVPAWGLIITFISLCTVLFFVMNANLVDQFQLSILVATTSVLLCYLYTAIAELLLLMRNNELQNKIGKMHAVIAFLAAIYSIWALTGADNNIIFYIMMLVLIISAFYVITIFIKHYKKT